MPDNTDAAIFDSYELVVGIELHTQLLTNSKIYSSEPNVFGEAPNTILSSVTLGYPGTLPVFNQKVVEAAVALCLATGARITPVNTFDRKNYFYPDLPKGYQITQYFNPIGRNGYVTLYNTGEPKQIRINRIHIEEDTGKSLHEQHPTKTLIDFNRAGRPLLEIVSEPDIRSAEEAGSYVAQMRQLLRYLGISDGNMEEGNLRCDINVSVRARGQNTLGERTEIKNLNSITNLQKAIKYEFKRQVLSIERAQPVTKSTLGFDVKSSKTFTLRAKEYAQDYRYFPDPDLTPFSLSAEFIENIKRSLPALPHNLYIYFTQTCGLSPKETAILLESKPLAYYYLDLISHTSSYKSAYNWLFGPLKAYLNKNALGVHQMPIEPKKLAALINFLEAGSINATLAQNQLLPAWIDETELTIEELAHKLSLTIDSDEDLVRRAIEMALKKYEDRIPIYQAGKKNLLALFMGEVMKITKGKINPKEVSSALQQSLDAYK